MALEDFKEIIGATAGVLTIGQLFSGVFICRDIYKKGNTENIPATLFVGGFFISLLFLIQGLLLKDATMEFVHFIGLGLRTGYVIFYYIYSTPKSRTAFTKKFLISLVFLGVVLVYIQIEDREKLEFRFGMLLAALLTCLIASPLLSVRKIIRTKNSESLPVPMLLIGTVAGINWLLYGIIIKSSGLITQCSINLVLAGIQLALWLIYPKKLTKSE